MKDAVTGALQALGLFAVGVVLCVAVSFVMPALPLGGDPVLETIVGFGLSYVIALLLGALFSVLTAARKIKNASPLWANDQQARRRILGAGAMAALIALVVLFFVYPLRTNPLAYMLANRLADWLPVGDEVMFIGQFTGILGGYSITVSGVLFVAAFFLTRLLLHRRALKKAST